MIVPLNVEYVPSVARLLRRIEALDPDVVHIQWTVLPRLDVRWLGAVASRRLTVLTAHDVRPRRPRDLGAWGDILRRVDRVVVHSETAVRDLAELGVDPRRVVAIRHPVFAAAPGKTLGPPQGSTLLFFGLLRSYKGLETLVAALGLVVERVPEARLVVAGDPMESVQPVRELADRLDLTGKIEWRLGFVPEQKVTALMQSATVVVLPYRDASASGVLATALGHHRPVVVSDVGSMGQLVREFGAGLVVPAEDATALASACVSLLTERDDLDLCARGARAAASALTWDDAAEAHERVYGHALREHARGTSASVCRS